MKLSRERVVKVLMELGLSERDAQVYVYLALNGPLKAKEITSQMGLYKEQLYRTLKKLRNRKVVRAIEGVPAFFSAIPFEGVLDLLAEIKKEQAQALQAARQELLDSWKSMNKNNSKNS